MSGSAGRHAALLMPTGGQVPRPVRSAVQPIPDRGNTTTACFVSDISLTYRDRSAASLTQNRSIIMNEFSNEISGQGARSRARFGRHLHHHRHHRVGGCVPEAGRDAGRLGSGERAERGEGIRAVHELRHALATVARTGDEQLRGEAAQILAEATSRLNGLLGADR